MGHVSKPKEEEPPAPPQLLTERDLERSVYLTLTETDTIFIMQVAGESCAGRPHTCKWAGAAHERGVRWRLRAGSCCCIRHQE